MFANPARHHQRWSHVISLTFLTLSVSACANGVTLNDIEGIEELGDQGDPAAPPEDESIVGRGLPCAVEEVIDAHCVQCHGVTPIFGAPMSLVSWGDWHATIVDPSEVRLKHSAGDGQNAGRHVFEVAVEAVRNIRSPMPPQPAPRLTSLQIDALAAWAEKDAPPGVGCAEAGEPDPIGRSPGPDAMTPPPNDGVVGPEDEGPPVDDRCEYMLELRANDGVTSEDAAGFAVPRSRDHYECFYFRLPYTGEAHGLSFHPLVDNARVLHHWLLYEETNSSVSDGHHEGCRGVHEGSELVAGWAPGGQPLVMPEGVGMKLPEGPDGVFVLEIHYNNSARLRDVRDRSGVRICATTDLQAQTAGMQWLGTEGLFMLLRGEHDFVGQCRPDLDEPVTIIKSSPHMHLRGRHLKTVIHRQGGAQETLIDEPFDFEHQVIYDTPATIYPGDWLETTCTFEHEGGLAGFGSGTDSEMCYNFVVAYPHGAMSTGGSLTQSENACLQ